ncbi:hypothetical protein GCM10020000_70160 [Streptomyces olivoverticillatus]
MAPVISSLNPNHGPPTGGTAVTINGSGFTGVTSVKFGIVAVASFTLVSDSQITTTAPRGHRVGRPHRHLTARHE